MPFVLLFFGVIALVAAILGNERDLGRLLVSDLTGAGNFLYWIGSIVLIGIMGYIPGLKIPSRAILALIIIVLLLNNRGFFAALSEQFQQGTSKAGETASQSETAANESQDTATPPASSSSGSSSSSSSGGSGSTLSTVAQVAEVAAIA